MKKRVAAAVLILAASLGLAGCASINTARDTVLDIFWDIFGGLGGSSSEDTVAVQSVSMLAGFGNVGLQDRYSGIVVSQATTNINKDADRKVKEMKVAVGDTVKKGDVLFTYDNEDLQLTIEQGKLEIEKLKNTIESTKKQIEQLNKELKKTKEGSSERLSYTIDIQSLEADNRENEYNLQVKETSQKRLEDSVGNVEVTSPIDGIVQKITTSEDGESDDEDFGDYGGSYGDESSGDAFIVLMETGNYRVKGTINEMNRNALLNMEGNSIIIRSRIDKSVTWAGSLEKIDTENPVSNSSGDYYGDEGDSEMTQSTNYPFYIALENSDGLMMGQHVYIELNQGQEEQKSGLWLPSYFLDQQDDGNYMWAATDRDRLERRAVTIGEYNEELDEYEILEGITPEDYIAIYDVNLEEGLPVTRYDEEYFDDTLDDEDLDEDMEGEDFEDEDFDEDMEGEDFEDEDFDEDMEGEEFEDENFDEDMEDEDFEDENFDDISIEDDWEEEEARVNMPEDGEFPMPEDGDVPMPEDDEEIVG